MPPESLRCKECKETYPLEARYVCERCFGPLEVLYSPRPQTDPAELRRRIQAGPHSLWRYADFLPVANPRGDTAGGLDPLLRADRLAEQLGLREVWIKNDAANPTHSFKDRVVSWHSRERGNSGSRRSRARPRATWPTRSLPMRPPRVSSPTCSSRPTWRSRRSGHRRVRHQPDGRARNYDDVNRLCTEISADYDWAFVNINMRPYYSEGSKTLAFETVEQLGWAIPDRVVCPIASGSLFTKIARGFEEWLEVGLIEGSLPTFNGAQATGCSPVATAFQEGNDFCRPVKPDTIAKSLAIGNPADGPYALDLARRTGGTVDAVSDDEIRDGIQLLARSTGIFTETAGGVTVAVLRKLAERGDIDPSERVVAYITGEGLKTLDCARGTFETWEIEPTLASFEQASDRVGVAA